jgi:hypothetical protein
MSVLRERGVRLPWESDSCPSMSRDHARYGEPFGVLSRALHFALVPQTSHVPRTECKPTDGLTDELHTSPSHADMLSACRPQLEAQEAAAAQQAAVERKAREESAKTISGLERRFTQVSSRSGTARRDSISKICRFGRRWGLSEQQLGKLQPHSTERQLNCRS